MRIYRFFIYTIFFLFGNILFAQNNSNERYVNTGDGLNMRRAPSVSSERIRTIPFGSRVTVISISENRITIDNISSSWYQIRFENDVGWVFGGYLSVISSQRNILVGDWQTETNYFRFYDDGRYRGGRKHSSLIASGNWFLAENNVLYLTGLAGDDSGELIKFTDVSNLLFVDNNTIKFSETGTPYLRGSLSPVETGLEPL
jgi:hypothetical protein